MVDNALIKQMLKKADAYPLYFGDDNHSYFWRAADIAGEIFVERSYVDRGEASTSYSYCLAYDKNNRDGIFSDIVIDFVSFYRNTWFYHEKTIVFSDIANVEDRGLKEILNVFNKSYSDFLNDVLYWFSISHEIDFGDDETIRYRDPSQFNSDARLAKTILNRLSDGVPLAIDIEDTTYLWEIVSAHGELWFRRETHRYHGDYVFVTEEFGRVSEKDNDGLEALRDAVRSCFYIDGWKIVETEKKPDDMLNIVGLSLEQLSN